MAKGKIPPQFLANIKAKQAAAKAGPEIQKHAQAALTHLGHIARLTGGASAPKPKAKKGK